jgi:hypothetical protein
MPSLRDTFSNWAAAAALWALPYLTLRHHLEPETSETLQWLLLAIAVFGTGHVFYLAWQVSRGRAWRASHGLLASLPAK